MDSVETRTNHRRGSSIAAVLALAIGSSQAYAASPGGEPTTPLGDASEDTEPPSQGTPLVLEAVSLDDLPLRQALALRVGDRLLLRPSDPRPEGPIAYALVRRDPPRIVLTLILANGHAYDREIDDVEGQSVRAAAIALVTLLDAVDTGEATPSRTDVEIPTPPPEPAPLPEPEVRVPAPNPEPSPEPLVVTEPPTLAPRHELGLTLTPQLGIGVAPLGPSPVLLGAGGSISAEIRSPRGLAGGAEVRLLTRNSDGLVLGRARLGLTGGVVVRRGLFELPLLAHAFVEPWWLRRDRERAPLGYGTEDAPHRPLLGAGLRASPGLFIASQRPPLPSIHIGARLDIDASFVPHQGAHSILIAVDQSDGSSSPAARLGGLELGLGLEVTFWFPLGPAHSE